MRKSAWLGVFALCVVVLFSQMAVAGTYYYQGRAVASDTPYHPSVRSHQRNSPDYYYQGHYEWVRPYAQGFPDYYFYRGRSPEDYYLRSQTWQDWDYGNAEVYDKITYERREKYRFVRNWGYQGNRYSQSYLDPGYYYYPGGDSPYFDSYGRYRYR